MSEYKKDITYFLKEGRVNMDKTLQLSFDAAQEYGIEHIVIYSALGAGVVKAIDDYLSKDQYSDINLIVAAFPRNTRLADGTIVDFPVSLKRRLRKLSIPIVRLTKKNFTQVIVKGSGINFRKIKLVSSMFGGSFPLCIEGAIAACEKGAIQSGTCVVSMSGDTAIIVTASNLQYFPGMFAIREILCKPVLMDITRKEGGSENEE